MATTSSIGSTATTDPNRKVWQKNAYDVANQTTSNATSVGFLRQNDSRVDVISTMDANMTQQVFSFQNVSNAKTSLLPNVETKNATIRVQLLNAGGQVIADSKAGMGAASNAYQQLTKGNYDLKQGTYYVVVQRGQDMPKNSKLAYNIQVKQGDTVHNDYITQTAPEPANLQHEQAVANAQQIAPTLFSTSSLLGGTTASDLFGMGGYNIFGQKTGT